MSAPALDRPLGPDVAPGPAGRRRGPWLLLGLVALLLVLLTALQGGSGEFRGALDPANPDDGGGQALARVLARQAVEVDVVRGADALARTDLDGAQVVVTGASSLGRSTVRDVRGRAARADAPLVVLGDGPAFTGTAPTTTRGRIGAGCADPLVRDLVVRAPRATPLLTSSGAPGECFTTPDGALLRLGGPETRLVAGGLLANEHILAADNAALGLRLLGRRDRLVWYVADVRDTLASDGVSLRSFLPRATEGLLVLGGAVVLAFLLWRARRFGPLVREPVPVAVRASETTRSRGRLYARARDRQHAATALRRGTRARLVQRLGLGATISPEPLTDALAAAGAIGATPPERSAALALLADGPVRDDATLVRVARDLAALEQDARDAAARPTR